MLLLICLAAVPGCPTILGIHDILATSCMMIYLPPHNDGGASVTGYLLERRSPGLEWIRVNDTPVIHLKHIVRKLAPSTKYQFRVAAVNQCGIGSFSEASELITTKGLSVPGQPGRPDVVKLVGTSVTLEWTAPGDDGGNEITGFIIRYGIPGADAAKYAEARYEAHVLTCTLTKLKPKTKYQFAVVAQNTLGRGPSSTYFEHVLTHKHSGKYQINTNEVFRVRCVSNKPNCVSF